MSLAGENSKVGSGRSRPPVSNLILPRASVLQDLSSYLIFKLQQIFLNYSGTRESSRESLADSDNGSCHRGLHRGGSISRTTYRLTAASKR